MVEHKENSNHNSEQDVTLKGAGSLEQSLAVERVVTIEQSKEENNIMENSNKQYSCQECKKIFLNFAALDDHLKFHHSQNNNVVEQSSSTEQNVNDAITEQITEQIPTLTQHDTTKQSHTEEKNATQSPCITNDKSDNVEQNGTTENVAIEYCVSRDTADERVTKCQSDTEELSVDIKQSNTSDQTSNVTIDHKLIIDQFDTTEPRVSELQNDAKGQNIHKVPGDSIEKIITMEQNQTHKEGYTCDQSNSLNINVATKQISLVEQCSLDTIERNSIQCESDNIVKRQSYSMNQSDILGNNTTNEPSDNMEYNNLIVLSDIVESTNCMELSAITEQSDTTEHSSSLEQNEIMGTIKISDKILTCQACSKTFLRENEFNHHQKWHLQEKEYPNPYVKLDQVYLFTCEVCKKGFMEHFRQDISLSMCKPCSYIVSTVQQACLDEPAQWNSLQHAQHFINSYVKMSRVKIYPCILCNNGYLDYVALKNHQKKYLVKTKTRVNSQNDNEIEKPYKCGSCDRRFVLKSTLEVHSILHKPFTHVCDCGIGYYKKSDLDIHRRLVHVNETSQTNKPVVKVEIKIDPKTDSELEQSDSDSKEEDYKPSSKVRARLKTKTEYEETDNNEPIQPNNSESLQEEEYKSSTTIAPRLRAALKIIKSRIEQTEQNFKYNNQNTQLTNSESLKEEEYKPNSRIGPKLKATLIYKQPKTKQPQRKRIRFKHESFDRNDSGRYICRSCPKTFAAARNLKDHLYEHTGGRPFECDECPKTFMYQNLLSAHKDRHAGIKRYPCEICGKKLANKASLKLHMVVHTKEKPYECKLCPSRFTQTGALKLHMLRHTGKKDHKCDLCDKLFFTEDAMVRHRRVHTREKPYECKYCKKSFSDPSARRRHEVLHTGDKPYRCQLCPKAFADNSALHVHVRRHAGVRYPCPLCPRVFKGRDGRLAHIKITHHDTGERYQCHHCDKQFTFKNYLVIHMEKHFPGAYTCDICGKIFDRKVYLKGHVSLTHLRNYKYKCLTCGLKISHKYKLSDHMARVHSKVKEMNYECDHCHRTFYNKADVLKHIVRIHLRIQCPLCKKVFVCAEALRRHEAKGCMQCPVCDRAFRSRKLLEEHSNVHVAASERQVHECTVCWKRFPVLKRLEVHMRSMHNEQSEFYCDHCSTKRHSKNAIRVHIWDKHMLSLYCDVCMKRFYSEAEFRDHKRTPCVQKQLVCEICEQMFPTNSRLLAHLKCHGPKKYECDTCKVKYKSRGLLLRHMHIIHKV